MFYTILPASLSLLSNYDKISLPSLETVSYLFIACIGVLLILEPFLLYIRKYTNYDNDKEYRIMLILFSTMACSTSIIRFTSEIYNKAIVVL